MNIRPRLFALLWLVAGLGVVPLSIALSLAAFEGNRWIAVEYGGVSKLDYFEANFALHLSLFGVICGFCVGSLQQFITSRTWRVKLNGWWRASTLGGLLGGMIIWLLVEPIAIFEWLWSLDLTPTQYSTLHFALPVLVMVMCLALAQASRLWRHASAVGSWLAAHALAVLLPTVCVLLYEPIAPSYTLSDGAGTIWFLSHFILLTICTGTVMRRIAPRVARAEKSKRKTHAPDSA